MTVFLITLGAVLAIFAVIGAAISGLLESTMDRYFQTSVLSDPRAGGSTDGAPPAPNPPAGAGGAFQTPEEK